MSYDQYRQNYQQVYQEPGRPNESDWKHEAVAGGAAFAAVHEWEAHEKKEGHPVNHAFAKEAIAGIAGAEVDKLFETHGLDWIDKEKAKHHAQRDAQNLYDQSYAQQDAQQYGQIPNQFYQPQQRPNW